MYQTCHVFFPLITYQASGHVEAVISYLCPTAAFSWRLIFLFDQCGFHFSQKYCPIARYRHRVGARNLFKVCASFYFPLQTMSRCVLCSKRSDLNAPLTKFTLSTLPRFKQSRGRLCQAPGKNPDLRHAAFGPSRVLHMENALKVSHSKGFTLIWSRFTPF